MKDIIASLRDKVVCCQAVIKLIARGKQTEVGGLMEIAKNLQIMYDLLKQANGK